MTLTLGHLRELIKAYFAHAQQLASLFRLSYVGRGKRLPARPARWPACPTCTRTFLVVNGDVLTDLDLHELVAFHRRQQAALTIASHVRRVKIDLGVLDVDEQSCIVGYRGREKPEQTYRVSMGIYVYEPRALRQIKPGEYLDFPDLVLRLLQSGEKVCAFETDCLWLDVGRPDDYAKAQELFAERGRGDRGCLDWRVPLSALDYGAEEEAAVLRVLRSQWLTMGEGKWPGSSRRSPQRWARTMPWP